MRLNRAFAAMVILLVALILGACQPVAAPAPTPTPGPRLATSPEDIVGIWAKPDVPWYSLFDEDGTYYGSGSLYVLQKQPSAASALDEFWFEGTQLFWRDTCEKPVAIYEVELLENGNLRLTAIEEACGNRRTGVEGELEPVR